MARLSPATGQARGNLKLTSDALAGQLAARLLPAYLVSGDEPLLAAEAADAVRAAARQAGCGEREVHFIERAADWADVRAAAGTLSLFGARRLLEIRMASGKPGVAGSAALVALLGRPDPDTLYLVLAPRLDRDAQNAEWVRAFERQGAWVQVWPVPAERLGAWLRERARRLQLQLNAEALEILATRTEGNLLAAQQELEKLALAGHSGGITAEILLAGVADSARFDVFALGEAALAADAPRALRMLAGLRAEGTEPTLVLWALNKAARDIWAAHSGGAAPGWGRQAAAIAQATRRVPQLDFGALAQRAARADRMIKGRLPGEAWEELSLLAAQLCALRVPALRAPAVAVAPPAPTR
jgi:DNA polymerase III subunit delta